MAVLSVLWRIAVAGFCFAAFMVGGIAFSLLLFPLVRLLSGGRSQYERRVRVAVRLSFATLLWVLRVLGMLRVDARNTALLRQSGAVLVLANHPSYLDIVVLIAHIPNAVCVVKSKLWQSPFFGGVVRAAGYIRNDEPETLIRNCTAKLAAGLPLIIFPEGTRTVPGAPLHFVRGAAHIALTTGVPILPVLLRCEPRVLTKGAKWYAMPPRVVRIEVEVQACVTPAALVAKERAGARSLTHALERFFVDRLALP
jgi:1-acyl-sn-glycerol-3-phosphate acyltransferase